MKRRGTIRDSEATTSSFISSHSGGYNRVLLSLSLSLPLSLYNSYNNMTTTQTHSHPHTKVIALSHIYNYMNLGLFTNIASMGLFKTYSQICLLFQFSPAPFRFSPGLLRFLDLFRFSPSSLYSSLDPIRRDRFPNILFRPRCYHT